MAADLTAAEIKRIRTKYGLTQQAFARVLGLGEASLVRYENGQTPSKANANLIRAADHADFMLECLERDGERITPEQRAHAEQVIYAEITLDEKGEIMDINERYMLTLEQEILNEQAASIMARIGRLRREAQIAGDDFAVAMYDDIIATIAERKREIIYVENDSFTKLAEIRGSITVLEGIAQRVHRRAA